MPQPPRPDGWKHGSTPANKPGGPAASRKAWQPGTPAARPTGRKVSRTGRLLVTSAVLGLLTVLAVLVILEWRRPDYPTLVLVAPDADTLAVPENAAGVNGVTALADFCKSGQSRPVLAADPDPAADRGAWKEKLDRRAKATVLYFAAHGAADAAGPFLWFPPKSGPLTDADKLPLADILKALGDLPASQPKLLVFDLARTPPNWALNGANPDFAGAMQGQAAAIDAVPGLAVVVSNGPGQTSWTADERRRSAFAVAFLEALRGADGEKLQEVSAATHFDRTAAAVQRWAAANRESNQQPVLLPAGSGRERAEKIRLVTLSNEGYPGPPAAAPVPAYPDQLAAEWKRATALAGGRPESAHPQKWREYLEWLARWERLVRIGADPKGIPGRAADLRKGIAHAARPDPDAAKTSLPAARALADVKPPPAGLSFDRLWAPVPPDTRAAEWERITKAVSNDATARAALARFVLDKAAADPSKDTLDTAGLVIEASGDAKDQPVELHYLRMLEKHLLAAPRPEAERLAAAISARQLAEQVAWGGDAGHAEQVARWTGPLVERADAVRQKGEDLLFDVKSESWKRAEEEFFKPATVDYTAARKRAVGVAGLLSLRDRTFARLPYYARWLAGYRGTQLDAGKVGDLLTDVTAAAVFAHKADALLRTPPKPDDVDDKLRELTASPDREAFKRVEDAFQKTVTEALKQSASAVVSNWLELDGVLSVPFVPDADRVKLAADLWRTGGTVAANAEQLKETGRPREPDPVTTAKRHLDAAAAYLNDPRLTDADAIGQRLRGIPAAARTTLGKVTQENVPLVDTTPDLAEAAHLARLSDPAAAVGVDPAPVAAERFYWRHRFLLAQARRFTLDGWCGLDPKTDDPANWYCQQAAGRLTAAAEADVRKVLPAEPKPTPKQDARLVVACAEERKRTPTVLTATPAGRLVVVPEDRTLPFEYSLAFAGERVGFPVAAVTPPDRLKGVEKNKDRVGRRLEERLATAAENTPVRTRGEFACGPAGKPATEDLTAVVLYRGREYRAVTPVAFAGDPTREVVNKPPTGEAAVALIADPNAVAGAVTILIDRSHSMEENKVGKQTLLEEAIEGVELLLDKLPPKCTVTVGTFVGKEDQRLVEVVAGPFLANRTDEQREQEMKKVRKVLPPRDFQSNTPVARAIGDALDAQAGAKFWPTQYTGARTLIVLTDGDDNYDGEKATNLLRRTLRAHPDLGLHLVVFNVDGAKAERERKNAVEQFGSLEADPDRDPGTTFKLYDQIKNREAFARELSQAVLPRLRYSGPKSGILTASVGTNQYGASPLLPPDWYDVKTGGVKPSRLNLTAGDRVLLLLTAAGGNPRLGVPAFAHEFAARSASRILTRGSEGGGEPVYLTLPQVSAVTSPKVQTVDLKLAAALERPVPAGSPTLHQPRPRLAWFDVTAADGKPPAFLRVENRADGPVAPVWDLTLPDWDENRSSSTGTATVRPPVVSGYWVDDLPAPAGAGDLDLGDFEPSVRALQDRKVYPGGGGADRFRGAALSDDKKYLTVWWDYDQPGRLVFARVTGWKKPVEERHRYYDASTRYTVRYGPLTPDHLKKVRLELYTADDLRKAGRGVTIPFPDRLAVGPAATMPAELLLQPAK
jgi:hypothetical protein